MNKSNSFEDLSLINPQQKSFSLKKQWKITFAGLFILIALAVGITLGILYYHDNVLTASKHPCADAAQRIIAAAMSDSNLAYPRLGYMCHTFGNRISGSDALEHALDWMVQSMQNDNLSNAHAEPVSVPSWIRGREYCNMLAPFNRSLAMLGLGGSVNTTSEIVGDVIVVSSFDDLQNKSALVNGKIVLYNVPFTTYGATVRYRSQGAIEAAKLGAIAALVRSVTPYSLYTPHTGATSRNSNGTNIPTAAITVEDTIWIQSLTDQGQTVTLSLYMESHFIEERMSRNVMGEVTGSESPHKVVVIGGHTDSWDVGQGAMDDGGGILVSWEAVRLLHSLGLVPKRTVRVVGWVNEENGGRGGTAYARDHMNETHIFAIESDGGATSPLGVQVTALPEAMDAISPIVALLNSIGAGQIAGGGGGADIEPLENLGVPVAALWTDMSKYFWFHHTNADTFDKMDEQEMRRCVATMAVVSYCVANADDDLPARNVTRVNKA